jgi:hypothetical protein
MSTEEYTYAGNGCTKRDEFRHLKPESLNTHQIETMAAVLDEAKEIVSGPRNKDYGAPSENHGCTATMFSAYLSRKMGTPVKVSARDVTMFNILQKISRDANCPSRDNAVDIAGYSANAEACSAASTS